MNTSKLWSMLRGGAVGAGLIAAGAPAQALEYNFGDVQVFFDTTVTAGASLRVAERNNNFLPEGNGGPVEPTTDVLTFSGLATAVGAGQVITLDTETGPDNFDGSMNTDDGRLNFDAGDLTSASVKMTNDIQANWANWTFFARVNSFYDAVLDSSSSFERSGIGDGAKTDAARDIDLLDFYVSGDFNVGNLPLNVRLGKQVISWGESTFVLNGINSVNPIDVNAFRRPGAEVKEGLIPVWALYGSIGLPYDLSLEAFYQLQWDEFKLDRPGTPFADSDSVLAGSLTGGNVGGSAMITGGPNPSIFLQRNCIYPDIISTSFDAAYTAAGLTDLVCGGTNPFVNFNTGFPIGQNEQHRLALSGGRPDIALVKSEDAGDQGQWGVALRWYSAELNSTEFGFYFMNYHSRLPIASERARFNPATSTWRTNLAVGDNGSAATRGSLLLGCTGAGTGLGAGGLTAATNPAKLAFLNNTIIADNEGIFATAEAIVGDGKAGADPLVAAVLGAPINDNSLLEGMILNCTLGLAQADPGLGLLVDGTELLAPNTIAGAPASISLFLEYPEDIRLVGFSFATTVGDWGVQGEISHRWDQPLQLDTDALTIAALGNLCILDFILGSDIFSSALDGLYTVGPTAVCGSTGVGTAEFSGFKREEVMTFDIGTTATYTPSNVVVEALGADLGILLTEVAAMYVPDIQDEDDFTGGALGNVCSAGSNLPLSGFLALDDRDGCRPTSFSWGYVLVGQLQYNSAFGTAVTLTPTIAWSHDVAGNSPGPLTNYRQGERQLSLQLNGTYQNTWRGGLSYTNLMGHEKYSRNTDRDFVSLNISYSF